MNTKICKAVISDIDELNNLLESLFSQEQEFAVNKQQQLNGLKLIISNPQIGEIFIIKVDNKIVGMLNILYTISTAKGNKVAIFEDFIIAKEYRKKGLGGKLIKFAIQYVQEQSCSRITLLTEKENVIAIKFYEKLGFQHSSMIPMRMQLQ